MNTSTISVTPIGCSKYVQYPLLLLFQYTSVIMDKGHCNVIIA